MALLGPTAYVIEEDGKPEMVHAERLKNYYNRNTEK